MDRKLGTALVLVLDDAEPFDAARAEVYPVARAKGLPFHITLLSPFVPCDDLSARLIAAVRVFFAGRPPLAFALTRLETFPGVVFAVPEPVEPMLETMHALHARFPGLPPYGGEFDETIPHATLAEIRPGGEVRVRRDLEARLGRHLPWEIQVERATLLEEFAPGRWRERERFALGG
jgi:hypothetical protein